MRTPCTDLRCAHALSDAEVQKSFVTPSELVAIRDQIDTVDSELVQLLAMRLALVTAAAEYKCERESVGDPTRVEAVLANVRSRSAGCGVDPSVIEAIYRVIIEEGIKCEVVAYEQHGSEGTVLNPLQLSTDVNGRLASSHLMSVMATMRAMRRLDDRPVARELLTKLVEAASWAPIGANRQDYRFVIVTDRSQLARLAPHWSKAMEFYLAALRPSTASAESLRFERVRAAMLYQSQRFAQIPAVIVACSEPVSFWKRLVGRPGPALCALSALGPVDRLRVLGNLHRWGSRASAASAYFAVENLLLAARAHGLGATLTTWHSAFEKDFKTVLRIPRGVHIYAIVPVGYPLGHFGSVRRRPVEQLIDREHWRG